MARMALACVALCCSATVYAAAADGVAAAHGPGKDASDVQAGSVGWNLQSLKAMQAEGSKHLSGLSEAWELAQRNDPEYRAAVEALRAAQTERAQGRAGLLPEVSARYYRGKSRGERKQLDAPPALARSDLDFDSDTAYVQVTQPILNYESYAEYRRGIALAEQGEARFQVERSARVLQLTETYLNAFLAHEVLRLNELLVESLEQEAEARRAMFEQNEGDRIAYHEVMARLALAKADVLTARDAALTAKRELEAITGVAFETLTGPGESFEPTLPVPASLSQWLERANARNPQLLLALAQQRVAEVDIKRAQAQHLPQLDFVANWTHANSENLSTLSQKYDTYQFGLSLSIPIFSGGYTTAVNARARDILRQRSNEAAAERERASVEVTRNYTGVVTGVDRIRALMASQESSELAVQAAREGYRHGANSNLDVLKQQDQLHRVRITLAQARVQYLLSLVSLWVAAGEPVDELFSSILFR